MDFCNCRPRIASSLPSWLEETPLNSYLGQLVGQVGLPQPSSTPCQSLPETGLIFPARGAAAHPSRWKSHLRNDHGHSLVSSEYFYPSNLLDPKSIYLTSTPFRWMPWNVEKPNIKRLLSQNQFFWLSLEVDTWFPTNPRDSSRPSPIV